MSTKEANVALLKQAYAAWNEKKGTDPSCWTCLLADDAKLRSLADGVSDGAFARERSGPAEIVGFLEDLSRDWEMLYFVVDEYIAQGDRVVAIGSTAWKNKATGKTASTPKVDVWRFRDGKAVDYAEYLDTAGVFAATQS